MLDYVRIINFHIIIIIIIIIKIVTKNRLADFYLSLIFYLAQTMLSLNRDRKPYCAIVHELRVLVCQQNKHIAGKLFKAP